MFFTEIVFQYFVWRVFRDLKNTVSLLYSTVAQIAAIDKLYLLIALRIIAIWIEWGLNRFISKLANCISDLTNLPMIHVHWNFYKATQFLLKIDALLIIPETTLIVIKLQIPKHRKTRNNYPWFQYTYFCCFHCLTLFSKFWMFSVFRITIQLLYTFLLHSKKSKISLQGQVF